MSNYAHLDYNAHYHHPSDSQRLLFTVEACAEISWDGDDKDRFTVGDIFLRDRQVCDTFTIRHLVDMPDGIEEFVRECIERDRKLIASQLPYEEPSDGFLPNPRSVFGGGRLSLEPDADS